MYALIVVESRDGHVTWNKRSNFSHKSSSHASRRCDSINDTIMTSWWNCPAAWIFEPENKF